MKEKLNTWNFSISFESKVAVKVNNFVTLVILVIISYYTLIYPLFCTTIFFAFPSSKSLLTGCHCLASFSPFVPSSPKRRLPQLSLPLIYLPPIFYPLPRGPIFPIPPLLLYIKPLFSINKQFRIDSFLDCEGLHWDFCSRSHLRRFCSVLHLQYPTLKYRTR